MTDNVGFEDLQRELEQLGGYPNQQFRTLHEWSVEWRCSENRADVMLTKLDRAGWLVPGKKRVRRRDGHFTLAACYRINAPKKAKGKK